MLFLSCHSPARNYKRVLEDILPTRDIIIDDKDRGQLSLSKD